MLEVGRRHPLPLPQLCVGHCFPAPSRPRGPAAALLPCCAAGAAPPVLCLVLMAVLCSSQNRRKCSLSLSSVLMAHLDPAAKQPVLRAAGQNGLLRFLCRTSTWQRDANLLSVALPFLCSWLCSGPTFSLSLQPETRTAPGLLGHENTCLPACVL